MKEIILSIISISLILTLFDLILPKGNMSDIIKYSLSFISLIILISPLINKNGWLDFNFETYNEIYYDQNLLNFINEKKLINDEKICNEIIKKTGINDAVVKIEYTVNELNAVYTGVNVYGCSYLQEIATELSTYLNVPVGEIRFYE